jgi:hypothetical protein
VTLSVSLTTRSLAVFRGVTSFPVGFRFLAAQPRGFGVSAGSGFLRPSRNPFIDGLLSSGQSHRVRTRRRAINTSKNASRPVASLPALFTAQSRPP